MNNETLEQMVSTLAKEVDTLKNEVTTLKNDVTTLKVSTASFASMINERFNNVVSSIQILTNKIDKLSQGPEKKWNLLVAAFVGAGFSITGTVIAGIILWKIKG